MDIVGWEQFDKITDIFLVIILVLISCCTRWSSLFSFAQFIQRKCPVRDLSLIDRLKNALDAFRKARQTVFVNGISSAIARGVADLVIFPFTLIKTRLEVRKPWILHFETIVNVSVEFSIYKNEHVDCY